MLGRLLRDSGLRRRLGIAGEHRVREEFSSIAGADRLAAKFRELLGSEASEVGVSPLPQGGGSGQAAPDQVGRAGSIAADRAA